MEVLVNLNKNDILQEVSKTSAYIGVKAITQDGNGNFYWNIAVTKEEQEMLDRFWKEACANIANSAHEYLKKTTKITGKDAESFMVSLEMPYGYNMASNTQIYQYAYSYVVSYILMKWLIVCGFASNMDLYVSTTAGNLKSFADSLRMRSFGGMAIKTGSNVFGEDEPQNVGAVDVIIKEL